MNCTELSVIDLVEEASNREFGRLVFDIHPLFYAYRTSSYFKDLLNVDYTPLGYYHDAIYREMSILQKCQDYLRTICIHPDAEGCRLMRKVERLNASLEKKSVILSDIMYQDNYW